MTASDRSSTQAVIASMAAKISVEDVYDIMLMKLMMFSMKVLPVGRDRSETEEYIRGGSLINKNAWLET